MKSFLILSFAGAIAAGALVSCSASERDVHTISSIGPYSGLTDRELNERYHVLLFELQELNQEMDAANQGRDFATVHAKAKEGLEKAHDARDLARRIDDETLREDRLRGITKIITDMEQLVEITR